MQNNAVRRRLLSTALIVFLCAMILANIASRMHDQLVPLYVQSLGASVEQVGLFFTITSIVPLAFQIIGGFVSDSIGRLRAVAMGSVAGAVGYLLFIVAPSWGWLMLAASISSLAGCFVGPSFQAFIAEQSTEETRGRVFAIVESLFTVVGVVGRRLEGYCRALRVPRNVHAARSTSPRRRYASGWRRVTGRPGTCRPAGPR